MRRPKAVRIELAADERAELEARARRRKTSRGGAMRAAIVLLAASGMANLGIAKRFGTTRATVATWRQRFACSRMDGLSGEPRSGAPRKTGDDKITEVVRATLETMPTAATHCTTRSMAKASLDLLSGWGVFGIGRNHPKLRDTLSSVLASDFPNLVQMDVSPLAYRASASSSASRCGCAAHLRTNATPIGELMIHPFRCHVMYVLCIISFDTRSPH